MYTLSTNYRCVKITNLFYRISGLQIENSTDRRSNSKNSGIYCDRVLDYTGIFHVGCRLVTSKRVLLTIDARRSTS